MIKLKKMMKKWLLSGCLLTLMACGQVPQERIDSLKETIADYEENGAGAEMPEEFRALQESFAEVERSVEAEKEKMVAMVEKRNAICTEIRTVGRIIHAARAGRTRTTGNVLYATCARIDTIRRTTHYYRTN